MHTNVMGKEREKPVCVNDDDNFEFNGYQAQVKGLAELFRRSPHNLIEEIEKLGFTYVVNRSEDAEEILEENAARLQTDVQIALVFYLDSADTPSEYLLNQWPEETQREDCHFSLWQRYFRTGNGQLKKLVLFGLDRYPASQDLLENLSFLHNFLWMPKELLVRYTIACDLENDPERFLQLAQGFDAESASFGYDALFALRARYADVDEKKILIDKLLLEREKSGEIIAF